VRLELNSTYLQLVYAADVNLIGGIIVTIKNTETVIDASNETKQEVKTETKHVLMSHHLNAEQNHNMKIANRFFENITKF
jgi:rubrerythrin